MSSFHFLKSYNRVKKFSGGVHFKIIFGKIRGREMQSASYGTGYMWCWWRVMHQSNGALYTLKRPKTCI